MQRAVALGPIGESAEQVDAAGLWLVQLLARHDPQARGLLPGLFQAARQRSDVGKSSALHARPSFWQALGRMLTQAGESLDDAAIELAASRWLLASHAGASYGVAPQATVPLLLDAPLSALPKRATHGASLLTYGSAYAAVDVREADAGQQLRVWLRAEPGPRWSLVALTLDAQGHELGRLSAPPRTLPEAFLPIELDARTARVVLIVTNLPHTANEPATATTDEACGFELTIDVARP